MDFYHQMEFAVVKKTFEKEHSFLALLWSSRFLLFFILGVSILNKSSNLLLKQLLCFSTFARLRPVPFLCSFLLLFLAFSIISLCIDLDRSNIAIGIIWDDFNSCKMNVRMVHLCFIFHLLSCFFFQLINDSRRFAFDDIQSELFCILLRLHLKIRCKTKSIWQWIVWLICSESGYKIYSLIFTKICLLTDDFCCLFNSEHSSLTFASVFDWRRKRCVSSEWFLPQEKQNMLSSEQKNHHLDAILFYILWFWQLFYISELISPKSDDFLLTSDFDEINCIFVMFFIPQK